MAPIFHSDKTPGIRYLVATMDDFDRVLKFTKVEFRNAEPCARNFRMTPEDIEAALSGTIEDSLKQNLSILAIDDTDRIVGYRIAMMAERSSWKKKESSNDGEQEDLTEAAIFGSLITGVKNDMWKLIPEGIDRVVRRELTCVRTDFQGKGIGTQLAVQNFSDELLKSLEIQAIVSETTSKANQHLLRKLGFEALSTIKYADAFAEAGWKEHIQLDDGTEHLIVNYRKL